MNTLTPSASETIRLELLAALARVRNRIESGATPIIPEAANPPPRPRARSRKTAGSVAAAPDAWAAAGGIVTPTRWPEPLQLIVERFSLTPFERDVLLLCAGVELDASFAGAVAAAQGMIGRGVATFGLALAALEGAHWSALAPTAALRHWRLVELGVGTGLTDAPLRIDERVLHFLTGLDYPDPRLAGVVHPVLAAAELSPTQNAAGHSLLSTWSGIANLESSPVLFLYGDDPEAHRAVLARVAGSLGLKLHQVRASALPVLPAERVALARLCERELMLGAGALLVALDGDASAEERENARAFVDATSLLAAVSAPEPFGLQRRPQVSVPLHRPAAPDQLALWKRALGSAAASFNGQLEEVAAQFQLDAPAIQRAARDTLAVPAAEAPRQLWQSCRREARATLEGLAQGIEPIAAWDDLVLPAAQKTMLRTIIAQVRQRSRVIEEWGFGSRGGRGLGIHALFAGPSGTGKTMAAEVIARELALDLHRIDLSALVSKYIGETEKNLRRVFDAAERGGSVLLFDEADALFGKRSEVRDSHDRYANIEVSYLLQRIESYRGLAILTSNLKSALDPAFARRLRFVVHFPFPDQAQRAEIWSRVFPAATPTDRLDHAKLSRLSLAGGHIRNVALNAAFLAADAGEPVRMSHLLAAIQAEYAKLEKPLTEAEVAGWS